MIIKMLLQATSFVVKLRNNFVLWNDSQQLNLNVCETDNLWEFLSQFCDKIAAVRDVSLVYQ